MPVAEVSLRLPPDVRTRVPVSVQPRALAPAFVGAYALGGAALFLAVVLGVPGVQLVMAAIGITVVVATTGAGMQLRQVKGRRLLIDTSSASLWFRPRASRGAWMVATAASTLAPVTAMIYGLVKGLPGSSSRSIVIGTSVIAVVGLIALARMLWAARFPEGLEMTELEINGIRGAGEAHLMWDDIADVGVVAAPAAKLSIADVNGSHPVLAAMPYLGADPNDVAVVLRFFRDHPEERSVLTTGGRAALRRVEKALSGTAV